MNFSPSFSSKSLISNEVKGKLKQIHKTTSKQNMLLIPVGKVQGDSAAYLEIANEERKLLS